MSHFGVADLGGVDFCGDNCGLFLSGECCSFSSEGTSRLEDGFLRQRITSLVYMYMYITLAQCIHMYTCIYRGDSSVRVRE